MFIPGGVAELMSGKGTKGMPVLRPTGGDRADRADRAFAGSPSLQASHTLVRQEGEMEKFVYYNYMNLKEKN